MLRVAGPLLFGLSAGTTCAEDEGTAPENVGGPLRCEVTAGRRLYSPSRPVRIRFTLQNTSDEAVEIPLGRALEADSAITLPAELIFGTSTQPALFANCRDEKPAPVPPPASADPAGPVQAGVLRLAGRSSVSTEVDLRDQVGALRYEGMHRLEWRPLGGRAGNSSVEFRIEPRKDVVLITDKPGNITFTLMYDEAPQNVENFLDLVRTGFYDGKSIHKILPGFLLQGGDPKNDGTGIRPDGRLVPAEFHNAPFQLGTLAMARKPSEPNSASCQFFVTLARLPELDGQYTVVGQSSDDESHRILNQIAREPTDAKGRPRVPVVIRSMRLIDVEQPGPTRIELKPRPPASPAPASTPRDSKPGEP